MQGSTRSGAPRLRRLAALVLVPVVAAALAGCASSRASSAQHGTTRYASFYSLALRGTLHYAVYLPPGYADGTRRYPVVYYLHGLPAQGDAYRQIGWITRALEQTGRPAILVSPQGARPGDPDPEWRDWGPGRNWESAVAVELVHVVENRYRTVATRAGRVILGVSAGGYGAALIAAHHPYTFSVIQSWSGYFEATNPAGTAALDLGSKDANDWANLHALLRPLTQHFGSLADSTWFSFYVGTNDGRFRKDNERLARELRGAHLAHVVFRLYAGGHSWSLWAGHAAEWLGAALREAAPPTSS